MTIASTSIPVDALDYTQASSHLNTLQKSNSVKLSRHSGHCVSVASAVTGGENHHSSASCAHMVSVSVFSLHSCIIVQSECYCD